MGQRIRCTHCKDEIESFHRHDFKWCKCHTIFIDGGDDYTRLGFTNGPSDYEECTDEQKEDNL